MGRINFGRVILGGIVAGIVINISEAILNAVVMAKDFEAAMVALGKPAAMTPQMLMVWLIYGFVLGILLVWLYAAIRPRYGPGAGTAVRAGLAVWFLNSFLVAVGFANMGLFPARLLAIGTVWGLFELVIAAVLGAWLYKEA
jgi:hypothetical protein